ncbi:hypothetical protein GGU10DRAFT_384018 [Lentinula aff. detonsa]|uniref:Uncharacterized protein n=1 Tax=Lentinula aff. detonsa TaxID=2804958 RepID=A0AA38NR96_9AGAR|nr:hypothetical protein GGU10DRAFT_384018 [Lentinula aff. detonsa]
MASSSTSTDGTATPVPLQRSSDSVGSKQATLESLTNTLSKLETDFHALNVSNSSDMNDFQLQTETELTNAKARQLHNDVVEYKNAHKDKIDEIKSRIRETYPNQVAQQLSPVIQGHIKAEVQACTKDEVKMQFEKLMPISLRQQLDEINGQLSTVKNAFSNSEARSSNSSIDIVDAVTRKDKLKPVLKPDGTKSSFWPLDLISLFAYDPETVKKLLRDYELPIDKAHDTNLNSFLGYIGIKQQVV